MSSSYLQISLWFDPSELVTVNPVKLLVPYGNSFKLPEGALSVNFNTQTIKLATSKTVKCMKMLVKMHTQS